MKTKLFCLWICFAFFLVACGGKKSYELANSTADSTRADAKTDTTLAGPKLVKTADMNFKVKNVQHTCEDIANLTASYHGLVMHHTMESSPQRTYDNPLNSDSVMHVTSYSTTAGMTVRIPSDKMEDFMNAVNKMAIYISNRNMDIKDESLDYLESNLKVQSRSEIISQQKTGNIKIKDPAKVLALNDDLIDEKLNARRIDAEVRYSTITLSFYQNNTIAKEVVVNDDPSSFRVPFFTQLRNSIANGWTGFNEVLVFLANIWVLLLLAAIGWFAWRYFGKKKVVTGAI